MNNFNIISILHFQYYLVDDTLEVREVHKANDGRDPFPVLIGRHKVPKNRYNIESSFPAVVMELSDNEIKEYYTPKDFKIGDTVVVYGRRFLLYDCDNFTKAFYYHHFGQTEFNPVEVDEKGRQLPKMVRNIHFLQTYGHIRITLSVVSPSVCLSIHSSSYLSVTLILC